MTSIFFFPRNQVDQKLYLELSNFINKKFKIFILHEKLNYKIKNNVYFISYEDKVLNQLKKLMMINGKIF